MDKDKILSGVAASEGISVGEAFVIEGGGEFCPIKIEISKDEIKKEVNRYKEALGGTKKELESFKESLGKMLGKEHIGLADAYRQILDDPLLTRDVPRQIQSGVNAEYALYMVLDKVIKSFMKLEDPYFKDRKNDIEDIGNKIMGHLLGPQKRLLSDIKDGAIVVAQNLTLNDTMVMRERQAGGFVTEMGGKTSHVSILAQALEIPSVVGVKGALSFVKTGDTVILDGINGKIIINPDEGLVSNYIREREKFIVVRREYEKLRDLPATTLDGKKIELAANFDNIQELPFVMSSGAEGIGLFRTEYIYFNRSNLPAEDELYENYSQAARKTLPNRVIIRTLDIGGDKLNDPMLEYHRQCPTFLGLRAIRLCLKFPHIFKPQLRAILRASNEGKITIMFPMISDVHELIAAKKMLEETKDELRKEGHPFDEKIKVAAMIEVPSAAMSCDFIAKEVDFISVGTNDLIQYTIAVERTDEMVAELYDPSHIGLLRILKHIVSSVHSANIKVGICGEMAADTKYTGILIGLGFDEMSVASSAVGKIKKEIRSMSAVEMSKKVDDLLKITNIDEIKQELKKLM